MNKITKPYVLRALRCALSVRKLSEGGPGVGSFSLILVEPSLRLLWRAPLLRQPFPRLALVWRTGRADLRSKEQQTRLVKRLVYTSCHSPMGCSRRRVLGN